MSYNNRTQEEYIQLYANDYCNGDVEEASRHAIVREVVKETKREGVDK